MSDALSPSPPASPPTPTTLSDCNSYGLLHKHRTLRIPTSAVRAADQAAASTWGGILCCVYTWIVEDDTVATPILTDYDFLEHTYPLDFVSAAQSAYAHVCSMADSTTDDCATRALCVEELVPDNRPMPNVPPPPLLPAPDPSPPSAPPAQPPSAPAAPVLVVVAIAAGAAVAVLAVCVVIFAMLVCRRRRARRARRFRALRPKARKPRAKPGVAVAMATPVHSPESSRDNTPSPPRPPAPVARREATLDA